MKAIAVCSLFLVLPLLSDAQKQGNTWYLGNSSGLDFNSGQPVKISGGTAGLSGLAGISDNAGKLLFFTDGQNAYNRNNITMPNGSGLYGTATSMQSAIILPKPGNDSLFYVFTSDALSNWGRVPRGYNYSIVDMCADSGRGAVITGMKNIHIADSGTEMICANYDTRGGYWIVGHRGFSDSFMAWRLTAAGLAAPVVTRIGPVTGGRKGSTTYGIRGLMKFNPIGNKLALVDNGTPNRTLSVFDFNLYTGVVNNYCQTVICPDTVSFLGGIEFSPDGTRLYLTHTEFRVPRVSRILQFVVPAQGFGCGNLLASSRDTIVESISPTAVSYSGLQLATDGKIYVTKSTVDSVSIGRFNKPDSLGSATGYDSSVVAFPPNSLIDKFPGFIAGFKYQSTKPTCYQAPTGIGRIPEAEVTIAPNPVDDLAIVQVRSAFSLKGCTLTVTDVFGKRVASIQVVQSPIRLDMSYTAPGLYFYQLRHGATIVKAGKFTVR